MKDKSAITELFKKELRELLEKHNAYLMAEYDGDGDEPYISAYIIHTEGKYQSSVSIYLGEIFE